MTHKDGATKPATGEKASSSVAVVICTRNRHESLRETLDSIWSQSRLPDELIVIDDGDLAVELENELAARARELGIDWKCQKTVQPGLTRGRNLAARIAESDVLQFLDDDVTCAPDFLAEVAALMSDPGVAGVTVQAEEPAFGSLGARLYQLGYRMAGWWCVAPRGRPPGRPPDVLKNPDAAIRTHRLSGAAMALRREIVLANPFDEQLTEYALGEDREMGLRLATRYWLIESKRAQVIHRRDMGQRTDSRRLGYMTTRNYLYILRKTSTPGPGEWLLIGWSLSILGVMHLLWSAIGNRAAHLGELRGMIEGLVDAWRASRRPDGRTFCGVFTAPRDVDFTGRAGGPPRRVLFVTNRLEPGGAELMMVGLLRRLPAHGIQPSVLCLQDAGPLAPECRAGGVPVYEGLLHNRTDAAVIARIARLIAQQSIDVVVVGHSGGDRMFWSTMTAALANIPVVVWSHWFPTAGKRHFERVNRILFRCVDAYVALGERHRQALIRHEHVPAGRIAVIRNAIDLDQYLFDASTGGSRSRRGDARRELRLDENQIGVAIIANLRKEKRHDVFIEAARRLAPTMPNLRFFIIGDGPNRDSVQAAAAASGLDHETLRLMGVRHDVPELLPGFDIVCLCSDIECFSVVMLEAAAAGCAFIGPNTGSLPEFLEHGVTGWAIRPADVADLTDAIRTLTGDAGLRSRMADAARRRVVREYDMESMAARFSRLLRSVQYSRSGWAGRQTESRRTESATTAAPDGWRLLSGRTAR